MTRPVSAQTERAVIYLRESDKRMVNMLDSQREACREYCAERDYHVVAELHDLMTGDELWGRDGLTEARAIFRDGGADVLVANDSTRLSRNQNHRVYIRQEILHHGGKVEFVTGSANDSKDEQFLEMIKEYAGDIAREKIREGATRGRLARAKRNAVLPGGMALYGYLWGEPVVRMNQDGTPRVVEGVVVTDKHARYAPNPQTAWVVQRVFEEVAEGRSLRKVAEGLNSDNVPTPSISGHGWGVPTLAKMISNPAYKGEARAFVKHSKIEEHGKQRGTNIRKRIRHLEDHHADKQVTLTADVVPPLVTADLWERANEQRRLAKDGLGPGGARQYTGSRLNPEDWLLVGHVRCAVCKHALLRQAPLLKGMLQPSLRYRCATSRKTPGARCGKGHSIGAKWLDRYVWNTITGLLEQPEQLAEVARILARQARQTEQQAGNKLADLAAVVQSLATLDAQIASTRQAVQILEAAPNGKALAATNREQLAILEGQRAKALADRAAIAPQAGAIREDAEAFAIVASEWATLAADLVRRYGRVTVTRRDLYASDSPDASLRSPAELTETMANAYNDLRLEAGWEDPLPTQEAAEKWLVGDDPFWIRQYLPPDTSAHISQSGTAADNDGSVDFSVLDPWLDEPLYAPELARELLERAGYAKKRELLARLGIIVWVKPRPQGEQRTRNDLDARWKRRVIIEVRPIVLHGYAFRIDPPESPEALEATSDSNRSMSARMTSKLDRQKSTDRMSMPNSEASVAASAIPVRESSASYLGTNENDGSSS